MNATPSLLRLPREAGIPDSVFDDLQLRRLFSEKTVQVLSRPCGKDGIPARQDIFRFLESKENEKKMRDCYADMKEYDRALKLWKASSIDTEKRFLFREMLKWYCTVCDSLAAFSDCGGLLGEMGAYWKAKEEERAEIRKTVSRMDELLARASEFDISIMESHWMTKDPVEKTIIDRFAETAEKLGLHLEEEKIGKVKLNDSIAHAVEELFSEEFAEIAALSEPYLSTDFNEPLSYVPEMDFFFELLALRDKAAGKNIPFCYPEIAAEKGYETEQVYDISLFIKDSPVIVPNDTFFTKDEPFYFLTGANGGGKTTYLRAVGINLVLFLAGCPIFAKSAKIYPFASVFSHFPADERFSAMGRLDEEKQRVDAMLAEAAKVESSFLVFNETYSGTDDKLGCEMTLETAENIKAFGGAGLFVTHFHEVRGKGFPMLNTVIDESNTQHRTFRIVRDYGIHSSFAEDILKKYKLDRVSLLDRSVKADTERKEEA